MNTQQANNEGPSSLTTIKVFLIGGPLLLSPLLFMTTTTSGSHRDSIGIVIGSLVAAGPMAVVWWIMAFFPKAWLVTWVPTLLSALGCGYVLRQLHGRQWHVRSNVAVRSAIAFLLCAGVSAVVYAACLHTEVALGLDTHRSTPGSPGFLQHFTGGRELMDMSGGTPIPAIDGGLLGGFLSWWTLRAVRQAPQVQSFAQRGAAWLRLEGWCLAIWLTYNVAPSMALWRAPALTRAQGVLEAITGVAAVLCLTIGYGLKRQKPWAAPLAIPAACASIAAFPIGSLLGIASLSYFVRGRLRGIVERPQ